jgi:TRAP-type C4-dicarboxylate transport system substrate-binding protein
VDGRGHSRLVRATRRMVACVALAALLAAYTAACGGGQSESADTVYTLRLSHHIPSSAPPARALEEWTRKVEEATGGRVQFVIYPAETLAKGRDALRATEDGVCDVANINFAYVGKRWSLNSVISLGSVAMPSGEGSEIWDQLQEHFPELAGEMGSVKVLAKSVSTSTSLHVKGQEIRVPDDIRGLKIAALGDSAFLVESAGAISVNVSSSDWATASEKGLIVGCMAPVYVVTDRGLEQITSTLG